MIVGGKSCSMGGGSLLERECAFDAVWRRWSAANPDIDVHSWLDIVGHFMRVGYVFSTPDLFLMGKGVSRSAPSSLISDCTTKFDRNDQDAWFIWYAWARGGVGELDSLRSFWRYEPYRLPYVGWEREDGRLRFYGMDRLKRVASALVYRTNEARISFANSSLDIH